MNDATCPNCGSDNLDDYPVCATMDMSVAPSAAFTVRPVRVTLTAFGSREINGN